MIVLKNGRQNLSLMVNSRFEYVKEFEREDQLLPDTFIVVEIHGRHFSRFCEQHKLCKPFDDRLTRLMAAAARTTMEDYADIKISFGYSDNFYLIFSRTAAPFNRRRDKIVSNVVSLFSSAFVYKWRDFFDTELVEAPEFCGKITLFPRRRTVVEFLLKEQLNATSFCIGKYVEAVAARTTSTQTTPTLFVDQNEFLFRHGINFNSLPAWHKRGKILFREKRVYECSDDFASQKRDAFWKKHAKLLKS